MLHATRLEAGRAQRDGLTHPGAGSPATGRGVAACAQNQPHHRPQDLDCSAPARTDGQSCLSYTRRHSRSDATAPEIVAGLRKMGYQVEIVGKPCDLLVRNPRTGKLDLLEVTGITQNRKRDPKQLAFLTDWQVALVKTLEDALRALGTTLL